MPVNTRTSIAPFLNVLREAVLRLPESVPSASIKDPIYLSFHKKAACSNERTFMTFEQAYTQCFKPNPQGPLIVDREFGGDLCLPRYNAQLNFDREEWDLTEPLINVLKPFQTATKGMLRRDVATIADVIPTFNILERKLIETAAKLWSVAKPTSRESASAQALLTGLEAGLGKVQQYQDLARESDLCLISTDYRANTPDPMILSARHAMAPNSSANPTNTWESEIYSNVPSFMESFDRELQEFLSGSYPCSPGISTLGWWKLYGFHFPTISHMACDFLCIPAASVLVERLFSQ
ncbi:unnamed protein product [Rhizoctonia solani]|uniref:HAT C-terminal dimerisation domain-containing protein n=1 Tax=Rhizoctonia solani TaxID=456999 RepID=A0A8H3C0W1_9AGAM|nr:unnamed protein product [Rhizoctonia solani]